MSYMLDTDTFSALVSDHPKVGVAAAKLDPAQIKLSVAAQAEVLFNAFEILPITSHVAGEYVQLRAHLKKLGTLIGPNDLWLAAYALSADMKFVTNKTREFKRVPELNVVNWL